MEKRLLPLKRYWLYVIKFENDKWYIGITTKTPQVRFYEHKHNIRAAAWTRKHKPVKLHGYRDLGVIDEHRAKIAENNAVKKYIQRYGLPSVRGGDISRTCDYHTFLTYPLNEDQWEGIKASLLLLLLMFIMLLALFFQRYK